MFKQESNQDKPPLLLVVLTEDSDPDRIAAKLPAFLRFSDEVTFGLEDLVERWESQAAPVSRFGSVRGVPPTTVGN